MIGIVGMPLNLFDENIYVYWHEISIETLWFSELCTIKCYHIYSLQYNFECDYPHLE